MVRSVEYNGDEEFVIYSYYYLPVITKEYATAAEIVSHFGCVPEGVLEDRMVRCIKITKRNRRNIEEGLDINVVFPEFDKEYAKTLRVEEVYRSW